MYARRAALLLLTDRRLERADLGARSAGAGDFHGRQLSARLARDRSRKPWRRSPMPASCRRISTTSSAPSRRCPGWITRASQRRWPNSLHVTVTEQTAAARWGESGLLNTRGELFVRAASPRARGAAALERSGGHASRRWRSATCPLQGRMLEAGMRIAALRLDERGAWEMDLDSGVTVRLGRRDVDERIDRFIRTASQVIAHRLTEITYVDMRYSNGFAIGWRNQGTPASVPAQTRRRYRRLKELFKETWQSVLIEICWWAWTSAPARSSPSSARSSPTARWRSSASAAIRRAA